MMLSQRQRNLLVLVGAFLLPGVASATLSQARPSVESAFQSVSEATLFPIQAPSAVEFPLSPPMQFQSAIVKDLTSGNMMSSHIRSERLLTPIPYEVFSSREDFELGKASIEMNDHDHVSFTAFPIAPNAFSGKKEIYIRTESTITSSALTFSFDKNVTIPATIDIRTVGLSGEETVVVAQRPLVYSAVNFPRTTASLWHITFTYHQPVRITEVAFAEDFPKYTDLHFLRFLATPNHAYQIFVHPDRYVQNSAGTQYSGDLVSNQGVVKVPAPIFFANAAFKESDEDADGVADKRDNCVSFPNPGQEDIDRNGVGEDCQDYDRDYVMNAKDNCKIVANTDQRDADSDGMGDVCDPQDSRFTEEHPWIPWVGIGSAGAVLILLFILTVRAKKLNDEEGVNI